MDTLQSKSPSDPEKKEPARKGTPESDGIVRLAAAAALIAILKSMPPKGPKLPKGT